MRRIWKIVGSAAAVLLLLFVLAPFWVQLAVSLAPAAEIGSPPFRWWPESPTLGNFAAVLDPSVGFVRALFNSLVVSLGTSLICLTLGAMAAYPLARAPLSRSGWLLGLALTGSMLPVIATVGPLFLFLRSAGLLNTLTGLALVDVAFGLPLSVWALTAFFREIPEELEEAARLDGCSTPGILWHILRPLALPGLVTTGILVFIFTWNEFLFALVFNTAMDARLASVAVALYPGRFEVPWGTLAAASVAVTWPVLILAGLFQRRIVSGLTQGALKG